jgi:hypothetical protein
LVSAVVSAERFYPFRCLKFSARRRSIPGSFGSH